MTAPVPHRIVRSIRAAKAHRLAEIEALLESTHADWAEAWDEFRAGAYRGPVPHPDIARLIDAADRFDRAGHAADAEYVRTTISRIETEKDDAASRASNLARQAHKPGGAAGRINRKPGAGFAELSQPAGDR